MLGKSQLNTIIAFLTEIKLITNDEVISWQLSVSSANTLLLYVSNGNFLHIKISCKPSLKAEFEHQTRAYALLQQFVPLPIGFYKLENYYLLISEGRSHRPFNANKKLFSNKVCSAIQMYFEACKINAVSKLSTNNQAYYSGLSPSAVSHIESYTPIQQHGDLTVTNIGWSDNQLMVFDWEDFGKICVPLFDLTTLIASLHQFDLDALKKTINNRKNAISMMVSAVLTRHSLTLEDYYFLVPCHLKIFANLKYHLGYSQTIIERTSIAAEHATKW